MKRSGRWSQATRLDRQSHPSGRTLRGAEGNKYTDGLQVRVTMVDEQVSPGVEAELTVTRGLAVRLSEILDSVINGASFFRDGERIHSQGEIARVNEEYADRIESINDSIERLNARFEAKRVSLLQQFVKLESAVGELQGAGNLLAAQLASLPAIQRIGS